MYISIVGICSCDIHLVSPVISFSFFIVNNVYIELQFTTVLRRKGGNEYFITDLKQNLNLETDKEQYCKSCKIYLP